MEVKSLMDIYNEEMALLGGEPVKVVQRVPCDRPGEYSGDVFCLIGIDGEEDVAFGFYQKRPNNLIRRTATKKQWYIWTPPKPIPHYPAIEIKKPFSHYATYRMTQTVYDSEEIARASLGDRFVRLATELPALMLVPKN